MTLHSIYFFIIHYTAFISLLFFIIRDIEALFADDCALMAHKENHLQVITDKFSEAAKLFGLTISLSKTEVLLQPAPASSPQQPSITIDDTQLKNVESF